MEKRRSGVLMPVSALPSNHGIGDFGKTAYEFVDLLKEGGFRIWQILPLNPLGYGNSPYQPYSSKAMDDLYISLDILYEEGLIKKAPAYNKYSSKIEYDELRAYKQHFLRLAFKKFVKDEEYEKFVKFDWVYNYAVFLTFKKSNRLNCWNDWPKFMKNWIIDKKLDLSLYSNDIDFEMFVQFILYKQWIKLKKYANDKGIEIMGDMPIYVGIDSDDVWANQKLFLLDSKGKPTFIAGVPPDYFSETGQRWGNPLYNWPKLKKSGFKFWIDRLDYNSKLFDIIRIDHFRAFDTYWKIPASCDTAIEGRWVKAPGYAFFDKVFEELPSINIVAEDLGDLRKEVLELRDHYNFKGMRIVQFSFDPTGMLKDNENLIIYTGTHDNQTIRGWYSKQNKKFKLQTEEFFKENNLNYGNIGLNMVGYTLSSNAEIAIVPLMDILNLTDKSRLNTPGTVGNPNWQYRLTRFTGFKKLTPKLKEMNIRFQRVKK
ncbi:MAG: 4-alpha-glucanotransferase [Erysipelotrichaceae bacterium]|nr:4-alpha-glucanotransferase [Erysipelotrichaceae bacterium]